jgi:hypothetical protein
MGPRKSGDVLHAPPDFDVRLLNRRTVVYRQNRGFDLTIGHLAKGRYLLERCRITSEDRFDAKDEVVTVVDHVHVADRLPPPGIELVPRAAAPSVTQGAHNGA